MHTQVVYTGFRRWLVRLFVHRVPGTHVVYTVQTLVVVRGAFEIVSGVKRRRM